MALFVTIVTPHFTQVLCRPARTILILILVFFLIGLARLGSIDSDSRVGAFWLLLSLIMLVTVFFLIPLSLNERLGVVRAGQRCQNR